MRIAALVLIALFCCGCARERAQHAADNRARMEASRTNVLEAIAWLAQMRDQARASGNESLAVAFGNIHDRLANAVTLIERAHDSEPAVAEVPIADMPKPAVSPEALAKDAKDDAPVPPEPNGGWLKVAGIASAIGLPLLFTIGRLAPAVPGLGTAVGAIANVAWAMLAHKDQKGADAAKDTVANYAGNLLAAAQAANSHPEIIAALKELAANGPIIQAPSSSSLATITLP